MFTRGSMPTGGCSLLLHLPKSSRCSCIFRFWWRRNFLELLLLQACPTFETNLFCWWRLLSIHILSLDRLVLELACNLTMSPLCCRHASQQWQEDNSKQTQQALVVHGSSNFNSHMPTTSHMPMTTQSYSHQLRTTIARLLLSSTCLDIISSLSIFWSSCFLASSSASSFASCSSMFLNDSVKLIG